MKILIAAIALTIAMPAAAQTAPAGHADHAVPATGHEGHEQGEHDGEKMDCCKDADGNGKMDCCEKHDKAEGHDGHQMNH